MNQTQAAVRVADFKDLVPVRSLDDLNYMVKESEILTGKPGRDFVVVGVDRPAFNVQLNPLGFQVMRIDADATLQQHTCATASELVNHTLGNALLCGLLYTSVIQ